ncbi:sensor histidine kinase [Paenibacillus gansuensis]|uniref:histidine kinase n=1 Tax=Paenibacillus gansuensis TaxID=306542 RepID=A0ABW5PFR0_9BACL
MSILDKLRKRTGSSMFSRTQNRLTLQYSGILMLFLVLFIVIVLSFLYYILISQPKNQLKALADDEAQALSYILTHKDSPKDGMRKKGEDFFTIGQNQFFYYLLDAQGNVQLGEEQHPAARKAILPKLAGWQAAPERIRYTRLSLIDKRRDIRLDPDLQMEQQVRLMSVGRGIYSGEERIGTLFVGRDIAFQSNLFRWSVLAFLALGVLFFALALALSHYMSKRAMGPIARSYERQREFVADASHELRTPLSVLLSSIDTLQMEESLEQDAFARRILSNMKGEVRRMTKLAGDLLTLARSDSGAVELQREPLDLRQLAEGVLRSLQPLAEAKQLRVELDAPTALPMLGDTDRLSQLLVILVDNAIKYTPDGGAVRVAMAASGAGAAGAGGTAGPGRAAAAWLDIAVSDSGIGIPPEEHERIFQRFYREDKSRSRALGGHGLGLAIAKWIVDTHRGTIAVDSAVGEGSTFHVRIPLG